MDINLQKDINTPDKGMFRLPKSERLRHRSLVNHLFAEGEAIYVYPLRMVYTLLDEQQMSTLFRSGYSEKIDDLQFMITVPKKKQRRAVDRVLMRRRIREAYRLNRLPLRKMVEGMSGKYLSLAFIYQSDKIHEFHDLEERMKKLLHKLEERLNVMSEDIQPQG